MRIFHRGVSLFLALVCFTIGTAAHAVLSSGIGGVATEALASVGPLAKLITAVSYVAGMAFVGGSIVKFKAHKDNPTQIPVGTPIALLFVGAALLFMPALFKATGATLFGSSGTIAGVSGITTFGVQKAS